MTATGNTTFKGTLTADAATGSVRITNAHPVGTYQIKVTSFGVGTSSSTTFNLTVNPVSVCSTVTFADAVTFAGTGTNFTDVRVADINNDGSQDLVTKIGTSDSLFLYLGQGNGTFTPAGSVATGVQSTARGTAIADFNGDGKMDIAVGNAIAGTLSIMPGNGDGTFGARYTVASLAPGWLTAADVNLDGRIDLLVSPFFGPQSLVIHIGNGDGTFAPLNFLIAGGSGFQTELAVADVNSDGFPDVVRAFNGGPVPGQVFRGNGNGTFQFTQNLGSGSGGAIAAGDIDGDSDQDVIIGLIPSLQNPISNNHLIFTNNSGTFPLAGVGYGGTTGLTSIVLGDLNGDGNQDVISAGGGIPNFGLGNGNGTFGPQQPISGGVPAESLQIGDFNGDGWQDIAGSAVTGVTAVSLRTCTSATPTPTPTPTATPTPSPTPTPTPTTTPTPVPTPPATPTPTPTPTPTATPSPTPTVTPSPSPSPTPIPSPSPTPIPTPTVNPTPTATPTPTPSLTPTPTPTPSGTRTIRVISAAGQPGGTVTVSIVLDALGNESSTSFSLVRASSPGIAAPDVLTDPSVVLGSGVPSGSNLATNLALAPGSVGILVDAVNTYAAGTREVVRITYSIPANAPIGLYPITFASTPTVQSVSNASGALLLTNYVSGFVQVGSTASGVEVSGRVLTPDGRGLRNAQVTVSDSNGNIRTATTSSFGFYRFEGIEAGSTVIVGVMSRRYRFAARVITAVDSVTDVNFTALE